MYRFIAALTVVFCVCWLSARLFGGGRTARHSRRNPPPKRKQRTLTLRKSMIRRRRHEDAHEGDRSVMPMVLKPIRTKCRLLVPRKIMVKFTPRHNRAGATAVGIMIRQILSHMNASSADRKTQVSSRRDLAIWTFVVFMCSAR